MTMRIPLIAAFLAAAAAGSSADLVVVVQGVEEAKGQIACAVFRSAAGFPMDRKNATMAQQQPAKPGTVEFRFEKLEPGTYAVAVSADRNSNGKTDKNFMGIPTEPWGVSNNARPKMRAPKFEEAAFAVKDGETRIEVRLNP
jgi:uncharacterized protein (DUF2141 family)